MALGVPLVGNDQLIDYLVIGGGVSGLSAVNRLADRGLSPVLIEAGDYPSHKVCGEFFSYECHPVLRDWGILPKAVIRRITYHVEGKGFTFELPEEARGMSRYLIDRMLWERARAKGVHCHTHAQVTQLRYNPAENYQYQIALNDGSSYRVKNLFLAAGRAFGLLSGSKRPLMRYKGYKAHFEVESPVDEINMHLFSGGYFGVSPIEGNRVNIAGLMRIDQPFSIPALCDGKMVFEKWMETEVPEFNFSGRKRHRFENLYLIGDAAASIAPASGDGLAMGITSAFAAADFSFKNDWIAYQKYWNKTYSSRLKAARGAHWLMQKPAMGKFALNLCSSFPQLFHLLFHATR